MHKIDLLIRVHLLGDIIVAEIVRLHGRQRPMVGFLADVPGPDGRTVHHPVVQPVGFFQLGNEDGLSDRRPANVAWKKNTIYMKWNWLDAAKGDKWIKPKQTKRAFFLESDIVRSDLLIPEIFTWDLRIRVRESWDENEYGYVVFWCLFLWQNYFIDTQQLIEQRHEPIL